MITSTKSAENLKATSTRAGDQSGQAPPKRVGLLSVMSPDCYTVPAMAEQARKFQIESVNALDELGFEVLRLDEITRTPEEGVAHIQELIQGGAEAIVLYIAGWAFSTTSAIGGLLNNPIPLILWTNARTDCAGLIGAAITKGALDEVGIEAPLVYGNFDDEKTRQKLKMLCTGTAAAWRLRGSRYGLGGTRSLDMLTAVVDPNQWLTQFGVDITGFDEIDVVERSNDIDPADVLRYQQWLKNTFGRVEVSDTVQEMSIRLYLALKQVIVEKHIDFLSVKCLPVMPKVLTSFCLSHALLGDGADADGPKERMICACEADSNGALTMQIMKHVNDQAINFADVRWLDPETNVLRISNCGSQATDLAKSPKDIHWVKHGLQELPWKHGGMCPQCVSKPGRVTLARLSRIKGKYVMLITGGESLDKSRDALKETYWEFSPHTFIKLDIPTDAFVNCLRSNHIHMMYGDYQNELLQTCRVLNIQPVIP